MLDARQMQRGFLLIMHEGHIFLRSTPSNDIVLRARLPLCFREDTNVLVRRRTQCHQRDVREITYFRLRLHAGQVVPDCVWFSGR
jgi:hypothetical protein